MSTSGTTTFNMTRDELIYAAVRKLAVIADGDTLTATQLSNAAQTLNVMLKGFQVDGMPLWAINEYNLPLTATSTYTFGVGQVINTPAPLKVLQAILHDNTAGTGIPLMMKSHVNFNELTNTTTTGTPNSFWYEPKNQTGVLHLWPIPDAYSISNRVVKLVYQRPFEDFVLGTDTADMPQFWLEAIIYGLAWRLCGEFGTPPNDRAVLAKEAELFHTRALSFGSEEGSLYFQPSWHGR